MPLPVEPSSPADRRRFAPHAGFRQGVAAVVLDSRNRVLLCERLSPPHSWQFPQGGIHAHESEQRALIRELGEEIGLLPHDVQIIACVLPRYAYKLRKNSKHFHTRGQQHRYYVVRMRDGVPLNLAADARPEFRAAKFVPAAEIPFADIFSKKRVIYHQVLTILEPLIGPVPPLPQAPRSEDDDDTDTPNPIPDAGQAHDQYAMNIAAFAEAAGGLMTASPPATAAVMAASPAPQTVPPAPSDPPSPMAGEGEGPPEEPLPLAEAPAPAGAEIGLGRFGDDDEPSLPADTADAHQAPLPAAPAEQLIELDVAAVEPDPPPEKPA